MAFVLCQNLLYSQSIQFNSFQGVAVPSPTISNVCPTSSYSFSAVLTNNTGAQLNASAAEIRITVSGANNAVYVLDAPGGNIANSASFAVTQTINMINPGSNSFAVEVYLDASPGTIIDSDFANIIVNPNTVSNDLLTPSFSQVNRQQIVEIELGNIGAVTGVSTSTFTVTLNTDSFLTTVASGTVNSVAQVATAIAANINANTNYAAANVGDINSNNKNVIRITRAQSGVAFNSSTTESSTMSFGPIRITAGSKSIDVCSDQPVVFNSSGGIGANGYNFFINNASATGQQTPQSFTMANPTNGDIVFARVTTSGSGSCVNQTFPISLNVTQTPEDAGSPIAITGTGFSAYNLNQSYEVTISGNIDAGTIKLYGIR